MVSIANAQTGIIRFVEREIAPSLSMLEKVVVGGVMNLISGKLPQIIAKITDNKLFAALDIYDGEKIDIDALYNAIKPYIGIDPIPLPIKVPVLGIDLNLVFSQREVETLYKYLKGVQS